LQIAPRGDENGRFEQAMPLILRIDVDRPYGRAPLWRHVASRIASDGYLPRIDALGYLRELITLLRLLNEHDAPAYVFYRRCTLPSHEVLELMRRGGHRLGLHLENSRTAQTFETERTALESAAGTAVCAVSKHGSGGEKYGRTHFAPYEPAKYEAWCAAARIPLFLGNLEDPTLEPVVGTQGVTVFPSAFWLEPAWRNTTRFSVDWLVERAKTHDVVVLIHPENTLGSSALRQDLARLLTSCRCRTFE
jgi:hypothetical protein